MRGVLSILSIALAVSFIIALFFGYWAVIDNENNIEDDLATASNNGEYSPQTIVITQDDLGTLQSDEVRGIPPFERLGGKIISKEQLNSFLKAEGLSIYVPKWVPEDLKLVAIWADASNGVDFPIILVYSSDDNDTDYRASENKLVIEIRGRASRFMNEDIFEYFVNKGAIPITEGGELIGVILKDAYCPTCSTQETLPLAIVKIGGLEYWINYDDVGSIIKLVESMIQVDAIT